MRHSTSGLPDLMEGDRYLKIPSVNNFHCSILLFLIPVVSSNLCVLLKCVNRRTGKISLVISN